jgi:hypothetical protein
MLLGIDADNLGDSGTVTRGEIQNRGRISRLNEQKHGCKRAKMDGVLAFQQHIAVTEWRQCPIEKIVPVPVGQRD